MLFRLPDAALGRIRVAPHAVWDLLAGAELLSPGRPLPQFPYRVWARAAMSGLTGGPATALVRWVGTWPRPHPPGFLLLPPKPGGSDLAAGLRQLCEQSPETIRDRLHEEFPEGVPRAFQRFADDPEAAIADLVTAMRAFDEVALRPFGTEIGSTVEDEVRHRGQVFAARGADGLLESLHTRIRWSRPTLSILAEVTAPASDPAEVVLVPLLFLRERVLLAQGPEPALHLGYQARGAANLAMRPDDAPEEEMDRLGVLLGRSRATVLRHLTTPRTTTLLAEILRLAPSTVSEHLALLVASRAALRFRRANKVYYELSDAGRELLGLFGPAPLE